MEDTLLTGRRVLVTGAAAGLGLETSRQLLALGAEVLLADVNREGGEQAIAQLQTQFPFARLQFQWLDLASLSQIDQFASTLLREGRALDILVNNAGILPPLQRRETADGFELKLGINLLGHFALTGRLLPLLEKSTAPRVVTVSSIAHRMGHIHFDDLQLQHTYDPERAYNQAKLGCLMFALELQRRSAAAGSRLISVAAHPGVARTRIGASRQGQRMTTLRQRLADWAFHFVMRFCGQSAEQGALPIVHAASVNAVEPGGFYGPDGFMQMRGQPARVRYHARADDPAACQRLWQAAESLTSVNFHFQNQADR